MLTLLSAVQNLNQNPTQVKREKTKATKKMQSQKQRKQNQKHRKMFMYPQLNILQWTILRLSLSMNLTKSN